MSRWKAASIHLCISGAIGLLSAALIFLVWYPQPYSHALGARQLIVLLLGVDVVLGPLLTLAVFKHGKKSLKFDIAVIACVQACALVYGLSVVARARPVYIVGGFDHFSVVTANLIDGDDLAKGRTPAFRQLPWTGPHVIGAAYPYEKKARDKFIIAGIGTGGIDNTPANYVDYSTQAKLMLEHARPVSVLTTDPAAAATIDSWSKAHDRIADSLVWVPIDASHANLTMLLDATSGAALAALDIDPNSVETRH